ncbi:RPS6KL1 isoform 15, partial [Pongo abelii]
SVREEQVKQWAAETLVALEALHEQGVLCRDLHPGNLLLDQAVVRGGAPVLRGGRGQSLQRPRGGWDFRADGSL